MNLRHISEFAECAQICRLYMTLEIAHEFAECTQMCRLCSTLISRMYMLNLQTSSTALRQFAAVSPKSLAHVLVMW